MCVGRVKDHICSNLSENGPLRSPEYVEGPSSVDEPQQRSDSESPAVMDRSDTSNTRASLDVTEGEPAVDMALAPHQSP